eukprot:GHRR01013029.1.p1 GENE.GHRR01013029.1~~GHRR01013029.1.p1  ORF type:complete len:323 (+),score=88.22 GHRR01013029.1:2317-3285(+)
MMLQLLKSACCRAPYAARQSNRHCIAKMASSTAAVDAGVKRLYVLDMMPFVYKSLPRSKADAEGSTPSKLLTAGGERGPVYELMDLFIHLLKRKEAPPTHMAVVVDAPGKTPRHKQWEYYKSNRPEPSDQVKNVVGTILGLVEAIGVPVLCVPGVEADDVVASLAARAANDGFEVLIISPDKDFYQLLCPGISILRSPMHEAKPYTAEDFEAEFDLPDPRLYIDVTALAGHRSDNIPGVKGIGTATALKLVQQVGTIENILKLFPLIEEFPRCYEPPEVVNQGKVCSTSQAAVLQSKDGQAAAKLAKDLVTLVTDLKHPPVK